MGSKNLKAISINALRSINLAEPEAFKEAVNKQIAAYKTSKGFQHHKANGTQDMQDNTNRKGIYPVRNNRYGRMPNPEKIAFPGYLKMRTGEFGCYSCMVRCGKIITVNSGPYAGAHSEGPEYESIQFTSNKSLATVIRKLIGDKEIISNIPKRRPDFIALPDSSIGIYSRDFFDERGEVQGLEKVLIIELKRGGFTVSSKEMRRTALNITGHQHRRQL